MRKSLRVVVRPLREDLLDEVVRVHRVGLAYSANSKLGSKHLAFLYRTMSRDPGSYVGVGLVNERPVGVISGTIDAGRLRAHMLRAISPANLVTLIAGVILQPGFLVDWWRSRAIAAPIRYAGTEVTAVLTAIAVAPEFQGVGIGRHLVRALEAFFSEHRVTTYRLDTLISNEQASAFYKRLGFQEVARRADSLVFLRVLCA
jgi:ribosomal protein S18 acetylase RimI-like enzyme